MGKIFLQHVKIWQSPCELTYYYDIYVIVQQGTICVLLHFMFGLYSVIYIHKSIIKIESLHWLAMCIELLHMYFFCLCANIYKHADYNYTYM